MVSVNDTHVTPSEVFVVDNVVDVVDDLVRTVDVDTADDHVSVVIDTLVDDLGLPVTSIVDINLLLSDVGFDRRPM